ncbi:MAG TPA: 16S rRNA (cytosine(1402)-N(4))-methyltransferase RsmH [Candidatus Polarisedimenticolia bacterium]|nr:16S rRNA (cytosine(1402)-N(4))-methyltransferase RsmH [Candidatus Polarisedimenticolia bacterium]
MFVEAVTVSHSRRVSDPPRHLPVLLDESLELLDLPEGGTAVDCTVGLGGHTRAMLEAVGPSGRVIGLDRDAESLSRARQELREYGPRFLPIHADYRELPGILSGLKVERVQGLLADFGFSSFQLETPERGFSFLADGPLDMRLDRSKGPTAAGLLASLEEAELCEILREFGEEPAARRIAKALCREQRKSPITSTLRLAEIVESAKGGRRGSRIHPATRTFQALRIAVNRELEGLEAFVEAACGLVSLGARAAFIAFHSLEDRMVKQTIARLVPHCVCPPALPVCVCGRLGMVEKVTRKAVRPRSQEIDLNPRARSARLRVVRRLESRA